MRSFGFVFMMAAVFLFSTSCSDVPPPAKKPVVAPLKKVDGPDITVGDQVWMVSNLDVVNFRNGDPIPHIQSDEEWEKAAMAGLPAFCYYNNDPVNGKRYGVLYNWYAATDPRGLAPEGWRVPVKEDFEQLKTKLGGLPTVGRRLKSAAGWEADGNGTDDVGFKSLPGGARGVTSGFKGQGRVAVYWTTAEKSNSFAYYRVLHSTRTDFYEEDDYKGSGFAVRCIKE
jgi:uncharacterized protein (TIGR02145 family)